MNKQDLLSKAFPSNNLATNAVCRAYDKGNITFKQWDGSKVTCNVLGEWLVTLPD